jgi:hypothetical protein
MSHVPCEATAMTIIAKKMAPQSEAKFRKETRSPNLPLIDPAVRLKAKTPEIYDQSPK